MTKNYLENASWLEELGDAPLYYNSLGLIHFDKRQINEHRVASLQLLSGELERLTYLKPIAVNSYDYLTMGLIIRGNDIEEFNYQLIFYDENQTIIKQSKQDVSSEITTTFKTICVTYKIPTRARFAKISWEIIGCSTGITLYKPYVSLK